MRAGKLDPSLADINHRAGSGGQRILLPTSITRADLKSIVEEQGFHLSGKDIAQGDTQRLLFSLPFWLKKREMAGVVLDLGYEIIVLLLSNHEVPSIRGRVRISPWMANFQKITWGGIACFKEKTSLWKQMFPHASQHGFLILSR